MDDRWRRPETELPGPLVHPKYRDMPYTYQATNDLPYEHPCREPYQCSAAQPI